MKRRTEITIETQKLLVVRRRGAEVKIWCAACTAQSRMVTPAEAARLCGTDARDIYRRIESGLLHFVEVAGGEPLVCSRSL